MSLVWRHCVVCSRSPYVTATVAFTGTLSKQTQTIKVSVAGLDYDDTKNISHTMRLLKGIPYVNRELIKDI